jgi:hypothetical protein
MTRKRFSSILGVGVLSMVAFANPQFATADLDNAGEEFILSVLPNYTTPNVEVHLTSAVATTVTVEYPVNAPTFTSSVAVNPGSITIVSLPSDAAQSWSSGVIQNNSFRLSAPVEFVAYTVDRAVYSSDAALGLPVDALNNEYVVTTYNEAFGNAEVAVTAVFDNTTVTITPSNDLGGGQLAGVPFSITLNRGEGYLFTAPAGAPGGLAGSIVESDKPVSVTNGNYCTQIPIGTSYCDHIYEQAQPTATWGNSVIAVNLAQRTGGTIYRVVTSEDNNDITLDGVSQGIINRGQYLEIGPIDSAHVIAGTKPIFATQFMTGSTSPGATEGDPAMSNLIPNDQFLSGYTFSTVGGGQFDVHYLTIVAKDSDVGSLIIDGVAVPPGSFTAVSGTGYSYAVLRVDEGTHNTSSANGHGLYLAGYNQDDSYLYPGGARFGFINPVGDANPPLCDLSLIDPALVQYSGTGTDNRPSEDINDNNILDAGEDLNNNGLIDKDKGIFFVQLLPGSSNLTLDVAPFVPGVGSVTYGLSATDPALPVSGGVLVTDGAGNTCQSSLAENQCEDTDLTPNLVAMDGAASDMLKLGKAIKKYLKRYSGNSTLGGSAISQLNALYLANWTLTWTELPKKAQDNCTNPQACVNVNSVTPLIDYNVDINQMVALNKGLIKKLKAAGAPLSLIQEFRRQNQEFLLDAQQNAAQIPTETLSCEDLMM